VFLAIFLKEIFMCLIVRFLDADFFWVRQLFFLLKPLQSVVFASFFFFLFPF